MIWTHVAAALVAAGLAFSAGWQVRAWKAGADRTQEAERAVRDQANRAQHADQAAVRHETTRAALQTQGQALDREIDHVVQTSVVYRDQCLDADGLRILASALGASAPGSAGEPETALPDTGPAR